MRVRLSSMLGALYFEMFIKDSCVKGLVPSAAGPRSGIWGKQSDHEGSDFISRLIHWWFQN